MKTVSLVLALMVCLVVSTDAQAFGRRQQNVVVVNNAAPVPVHSSQAFAFRTGFNNRSFAFSAGYGTGFNNRAFAFPNQYGSAAIFRQQFAFGGYGTPALGLSAGQCTDAQAFRSLLLIGR